MKLCISLGKFELKYFFYCTLFVVLEICIYYFTYFYEETLINKNPLMHSFCFFLGYLLNFIPTLISHIKEKEKPIINKFKEEENNNSIEYIYNKPYEKYLSIKDILKFCFICLFLLIADLIERFDNLFENKNNDNKFSDEFTFIEFLIFFLVSKFDKEAYYKHQYISFLFFILIDVIKNIYFFSKNLYRSSIIIIIILNIIDSILTSIYYLYIKKFMKYKFISAAKWNFMIGIINVPTIILIYFIISFTSLGNKNDNKYYYNIFELFKQIGNIDAKNMIFLILLPFAYGIFHYILTKIIYDYTIFHIYIPFILENFLNNIFYSFGNNERIFLISSFFIELIMILIFLEIIEINCCGLNENLKRNIQSRGIIDSSLAIENDDNDEIDDEKNNTIISTTKY